MVASPTDLVSEHPSIARYLTNPPPEPTAWNEIENHIVCDDAVEVLASLPSDSVDLVHTSPPYNINRPYNSSSHDKSPTSEYQEFLRQAIGELKRVIRPGGSIFWQTGYTKDADDTSEIIPIDLMSYDIFRDGPVPFKLWDRIIWRYWGGHAFKRKFTNKHETILWFVKPGSDPVFFVDEVRERAKEYDKRNNFWGRNPGNVWEVDRVAFGSTEQTSHIAVFPEEVTERIVRACSEPESLVLDPFAGSGTVPAVARSLGRRWLGIEISPVYAAEASVRLGFQQPSESEALASGMIKHVAFSGRKGILTLDEVTRRLRAWAAVCPLDVFDRQLQRDIDSVFYDGNGRNLRKREIWMKYDGLLGDQSELDHPVVLADQLLLNCYKLRRHFNGVRRYRSALSALGEVLSDLTTASAREYLQGIVTQEPSSFLASERHLEFIAPKRRPTIHGSDDSTSIERTQELALDSIQVRMDL